MKWTVPVGTGEKVRAALDARGLDNVGYVSNPEFTAEGTAVRDFMEPDRVVDRRLRRGRRRRRRGAARRDRRAGRARGRELRRDDQARRERVPRHADQLHQRDRERLRARRRRRRAASREGIGLDHRLGPHFLRAGIGWGGSCFPKDSLALKQLAANSGYHFQLLNAVIEVNELQKRRVVQKLQQHLGRLRGKTIALLGLAFKPNTDDMREAPSLVLASRLLAEGAEVRGWDPVARPRPAGGQLCDRRSRPSRARTRP